MPRARVASLCHEKPDLGRDCLNLTLLGAPKHWLIFVEPMLVEGPYGLGRWVRAIGIQPDEPEELERLLARGLP